MSTTAASERTAADPRPGALAAAELGTLALALGTAAGFTRLFLGWEFLGRLAVPVVLSWASSLVLRRLRVPLRVSVPASLAVGLVVVTWRFAPGSSWLGVPTPDTATVLRSELRDAFGGFRSLVAPVPAATGFLVVLAAALWVFGLFADTAAFRFRAPVQAAIPYVATFVATGVLAREAGRVGATWWFGVALAAYAVSQRAWQASRRRWVRGEAARGTRAVLAGASVAVAVALTAGLVFGPRLPGGANPVVDLRQLGRDAADRTVVSPFVSVRSLLGERSDQVVFGVGTDRPAYWRLTSLDTYDPTRDIWTSRRTYRRAEGALPQQGPTPPATETVDQSVRIASLGGPWLPAAFEAVRLRSGEDVSWDPASASLIARGDGLAAGATYAVRSAVPRVERTALNGTSIGTGLDPVYTEDPGLDPDVLRAARLATNDAVGPYGTALALQQFFRNGFAYDESVDYSASADPTAAFMSERRGFCQQFASTFALLARALGLPARVAVGFTPGDPTEDVDQALSGGSDGPPRPGYVVRGRHAHAWPEVWFDDIGWLAFEPTPGRGDPTATSYTGVAGDQADPPAGTPSSTTQATDPEGSTTTSVPADRGTVPTGGSLGTDAGSADRGAGGGGLPWWPATLALVLAVAAAVPAVLVLRRRRRHSALRRDPVAGRVAVAWSSAVEWLALLDVAPRPDETPLEFVARVDRALPELGGEEELLTLARAETARRFGPSAPDDTTVERAEAAADALVARVRERVGGSGRARALVR